MLSKLIIFCLNQTLQKYMTQNKNDLKIQLIKDQIQTPLPRQSGLQFYATDYKKFDAAPQITLSGLALVMLCPILIAAHLFLAKTVQIPIIQYSFVTLLVAFIINYTLIIRKYQLMPFLPEQIYDNKLKKACVLGLAGILCSMTWGWNGTGGIIFGIMWEQTRGNKMGTFGYLYGIIIIGSLLMEKNYTLMKLVEFIPGILFGMVNSILFTLKDSSTYAMTHQFVFLGSICIPMFFPASHLVVPSLLQWAIMLVTGVSMLFTVLLTVKLMQGERTSIVMSVMSGLLMLGTSSYLSAIDFIGGTVIIVGVLLVVKKEYLDIQY